MRFRADQMRGASAEVDYSLARRHLIAEHKRGRLARHEICDAHPELLRAAREVGDVSRTDCPICEEDKLRLVTYVFGPRLPAHGRCITRPGEVQELVKKAGVFTAYVVEVCPACGWNHLATSRELSSRARRQSVSEARS